MKELSIEEKAKRYDEAIKKLRSLHNNYDTVSTLIDVKEELENIFPELKESKDDRISKALVKYFTSSITNPDYEICGVPFKEVVAWLEKQGEMDMESYKAAENEKREFVGDGFIKCYADFQDFKEGNTYWLEYVGNDNYNVRSDNLLGKTYHITPCQLYTIFKKQTWLEKQSEQNPTIIIPKFRVDDEIKTTNEEPLTITKIDEKGYWSEDLFICNFDDAVVWDIVERKPAEWSKEDEAKLNDAIDACKAKYGNMSYTADFLKSLKERLQH